jgi:transcriptional regulator PpsR
MAHIDRQFEMPGKFLTDLDADTAAELMTASADIVLVLDQDGVIQDLALATDDLLELGCRHWLSKPWSQTVTVESQPKVEALLKQAVSSDGVRWRHVNHATEAGTELPLSYSVVPVRRKGKHNHRNAPHTLAFGRDLRPQVALQQRLLTAQQSLERDYWRLRQVETRYRLLFQTAAEPVLILEGSIDKVEEANPAALELFGEKAKRPGWSLAESLSSGDAEALRQMLDRLRSAGTADNVTLKVQGQQAPLSVTATQFRQDKASYFLLRFHRPQDLAPVAAGDGRQQLLKVLESAPDALVVTELSGHILAVNQAFLDMAQVPSEDLARGQMLDKWLGRTGVEFRVLVSNLRQHGSVRLFATQMQGEQGGLTEVEISAVAVNSGAQRCLGFTIRDMGRRLNADGRGNKQLPRSASQMTELVGRLPLKDIVRETTDLIEQLCIEAALELTGDNRASAAEMLGLSRQSLYIKLRRFGVGDSGAGPEDAD